jgi:hypothetical protein
MKKRLRRKKHKRHFFDIYCDVSQSKAPAQAIVDANGQDVLLTPSMLRQEYSYLARDMVRWNLKFVARTVPSGEMPDLWVDDGHNVIFEFRAVEFPILKNYSGNNPSRFKRPSN